MLNYIHNRIDIPIRVAVETGSMTARLPPREKGANVERWNEKAKALNESTEPLRLDMTIDEFDAKYKLKTHEDIMEMMKPL